MSRSLRKNPTALVSAAAVLGGLLLGSEATAVAAQPENDRTVDYRGYSVQVPADWSVVDLEARPETCVRFDTPTVYLGRPGDQSACAGNTVGRTAGLLLQPLDAPALSAAEGAPVHAERGSAQPTGTELDPARPAWRDGSFELAVEGAGVLATAVHNGTDAAVVAEVLKSASLTDAARPSAAPQPRSTGDVGAAAVAAQPGTYKGKGFDACAAPSNSAMDAWLSSPYRAIGVYTSGGSRACGQSNLTANWVSRQVGKGWKLTPIHVGPQAPCTNYRSRFSSNPTTAKQQGVEQADIAVDAAKRLGLPAGSAIYLDIEAYSRGGSCTTAVLSHTSGWTERLHQHGYLSGFYSSGASGITDMNNHHGSSTYTLPDHLWGAWWNGKANTDFGPYLDAGKWAQGQRIKQYVGEVGETHGGVRISIDRNYLDVRAGTPPEPTVCVTAQLSFATYPALAAGAEGDRVIAAQCLLRANGHDTGGEQPSGKLDESTMAAVKAFQNKVGLTAAGTVDSRTWTALLSAGSTPLLKDGSSGAAVSRLQRALNAATTAKLSVDGQFGPNTTSAVRTYQSSRGLGVDGIVGPNTWSALQAGK
ncbi:Peptidoglycan-binding (PGRP) domain of peptidoglycan hydrolases-containing protein [Amycolatopsis marina]|uniref:Peptidoglycan-binding (PGRP) domain of peptidoglycan hydrolases-containing protein n=1 Tax=Amycolatopsis marina TaxID=490629 RepID=A0A1I0V7K6_9PSEU|nr:glycoside hydrolase domain-containing protein [Amycolatopsis marina]SFA72258.1 Peptidoglycan-binding (PGRP) domain of peptidoglycan hydrolases-containing protein [Amycolatopsis marina]